jgi:thioredoxin 2
MMAPHFAEAAQRLAGAAVFLKMNADQCQAPARLGVRGIPAVFLFEDGKKIAHQAGLMTADGLVQWIQSARRAP